MRNYNHLQPFPAASVITDTHMRTHKITHFFLVPFINSHYGVKFIPLIIYSCSFNTALVNFSKICMKMPDGRKTLASKMHCDHSFSLNIAHLLAFSKNMANCCHFNPVKVLYTNLLTFTQLLIYVEHHLSR